MKAIFLILFVFSTFMLLLGYTASSGQGNTLGNALIIGGVLIYIGIFTTWALFKYKEKQDGN